MIPSKLIDTMDDSYFAQVLSACPRRARETLFTRFGIAKAKKKASALLPSKDPERIRRLQLAIGQLSAEDEQGQQLSEELVRVYLMTRRSLLGQALDGIDVNHDDGLTDADLDGFAELDDEALASLRSSLAGDHNPSDVDLYLRFMGADIK